MDESLNLKTLPMDVIFCIFERCDFTSLASLTKVNKMFLDIIFKNIDYFLNKKCGRLITLRKSAPTPTLYPYFSGKNMSLLYYLGNFVRPHQYLTCCICFKSLFSICNNWAVFICDCPRHLDEEKCNLKIISKIKDKNFMFYCHNSCVSFLTLNKISWIYCPLCFSSSVAYKIHPWSF